MNPQLRVHFDDPLRIAFEIEDGGIPVVAELGRDAIHRLATRMSAWLNGTVATASQPSLQSQLDAAHRMLDAA